MYYTLPIDWSKNEETGLFEAKVALSNSTDEAIVSLTNMRLIGAEFVIAETPSPLALEKEETVKVRVVTDAEFVEKTTVDTFKTYSADKLNEMGDINGDGAVNGKDSNMMTRIVSGNVVPTLVEKIAADVKEDYSVNGADANSLKRKIAGN
jgi:hypothetical protein